jgi:UDP:flavonoid glycosyltransferase YjiC (YdhE family)
VSAGRRIFIGAFGDPGHAFPAIALAGELVRKGAEVSLETAEPWRAHVEACGARFFRAPEFDVFPTMGRHLKPYEAVSRALETTRPAVREVRPDVVVNDILTLAPALAAELEEIPRATLVPHLNPVAAEGSPPFGLGSSVPSNPVSKAFWDALSVPVKKGLEIGMREYDELRTRVGLAPRGLLHGAMSDDLVIIGTFPQLEDGRSHPAHFHVTGPLFWEPPTDEIELPTGDQPLVLIAPSTAQDESHQMLRAALEGLRDPQIRVIATWNRRPLKGQIDVASNTKLVEWLSYSKTIPHCAAVVSHAGHGTLGRTLQAGAVPVLCPYSGDQFENAARVVHSKVGVRLPRRLLRPRNLALAVEQALSSTEIRDNARAVGQWAQEHDGTARAAELVLQLAAR